MKGATGRAQQTFPREGSTQVHTRQRFSRTSAPNSSPLVSSISPHSQHRGRHKPLTHSPPRVPDAALRYRRLVAPRGSLSRLSQPHSRPTKPIRASVTPRYAELGPFGRALSTPVLTGVSGAQILEQTANALIQSRRASHSIRFRTVVALLPEREQIYDAGKLAQLRAPCSAGCLPSAAASTEFAAPHKSTDSSHHKSPQASNPQRFASLLYGQISKLESLNAIKSPITF